jgi:hypothetical protein
MKAITLHAPYATLLVTRQPLAPLSAGDLSLAIVRAKQPPPSMVKQWHTSDEPCPPEGIGQRVQFTETGRFTVEPADGWTECACITATCRHGDERMREYRAWTVWDNVRDDHAYTRQSGVEVEYLRKRDAAAVADSLNGRIVGSGIITESLPITTDFKICRSAHIQRHSDTLEYWPQIDDQAGPFSIRTNPVDISDQLPYGDWTPGRWAWRITEAAPTTGPLP